MIPQHNGRDGRPLDPVPRKPVQIGSAASGAQNRINHMCMSLEVGPEP